MVVKTHFITLLVAISVAGCGPEKRKAEAPTQLKDTIPPVMSMIGNNVDTAYLYAAYRDPGVELHDERDGYRWCAEEAALEVTGRINNRLPGTYFLTYNAKDDAGNQAAALTRTVHVVENSAGFLNGFYTVACSCTAGVAASPNPSVTADSYTAIVASGSANNNFELSSLRIGSERVTASAHLNSNAIEVGYFSPDYASSSGSGTLSFTKNTFTIVNTAYPFSPALIYVCKNVYTRQLIIAENTYK